MAEYLFFRLPFAGTQIARLGGMVGTPENCVAILEHGECVMVFPEGARGANKPYRKRYELQRFGTGFMHFGEPLRFEGDSGDEDAVTEQKVEVVKDALRGLLARGLEQRKGIFF